MVIIANISVISYNDPVLSDYYTWKYSDDPEGLHFLQLNEFPLHTGMLKVSL